MTEHIGSRITIPGTKGHGILKYVGSIEGKVGVFGGVELIGPIAASRGKNSGSVDGIQYFDVDRPMTGLFLPYEKLKMENQQLAGVAKRRAPTVASSPSTSSYINNPKNIESNSSKTKRYTHTEALKSSSHSNLVDDESLQQKYDSLKILYETTKLEMSEKTLILEDLRKTVSEIHPLLEDYEREAIEKDKRFEKYRSDYEKARREWKGTLDLMIASQQENELLYETQIKELTKKLDTEKDADSIDELGVRDTKMQGDIIELQRVLEKLRIELKEETQKRNELKIENTGLKELIEEISRKNTNEKDDIQLLRSMNTISLDDKDYIKTIEELKAELQLRPTFEELNELQRSVIELEAMYEKELDGKQRANEIENASPKHLEPREDKLKVSEFNHVLIEHDNNTINSPLPIYKPPIRTDPSKGKSLWCGLCDNEGHTSLHCPYDDSIF